MVRARSAKAAESEQNIQLALAGLNNGTYSTLGQARRALGVSKATLRRRRDGGKNRAQGKENQQLLTISEEQALAAWISRATATGNPVQQLFIRDMAEQLRKSRITSQIEFTPPIGETWVPQFLKRYPHLNTKLSKSIEASHVKHVIKEQVIAFFNETYEVIKKRNIKLKDIYNVDETGICLNYMAHNRLCYWYTSINTCRNRYWICRQALYTSTWTSRVGHIH
jgi:Tc5 transposase DNA-binding domain